MCGTVKKIGKGETLHISKRNPSVRIIRLSITILNFTGDCVSLNFFFSSELHFISA